MTDKHRVSAVIPVHNGEAYLGEAISSVLEQTLPPVECIVIDDGSTDATPDVVHEFGDAVMYVRQEQAGVSVARNHGVACAGGDFIAFLDHDDAWLPQKLEQQLIALAGPEPALVICAMVLVDAHGNISGEHRLHADGDLVTGMLMFDGVAIPSCSSTGLIRRNDFNRLGGFDPRLGTSADWDLLFNVLLRGRLVYVDEPLVRYRLHGSNMSRNIVATERDMLYAFSKAFADPMLPAGLRDRRRLAYARLYRMLAGSYWQNGELLSSMRTGAAWLLRDPRKLLEAAENVFRR